jgi:glutamate/aspartate transport system substrate-binding protein
VIRTLTLRNLLACTCLLLAAGGQQAQAEAEASSPTLEKIRATGVVYLGYREASAPFAYLDADGKAIGFSLDLCRHVTDAIQARLNLPALAVVQVPTTQGSRQVMLEAETIDLNCGPTTNSEQRQRSVAFSVTTFVASVKAVVRRDSAVRSIQDLTNKVVVTTAGTTADAYIKSAAAQQNLLINYRVGRDHAESLRLLLRGGADVLVLDDALLADLLLNTPPAERERLLVLADTYGFEPYALEFRRQEPEFKKLVDDTLISLMNGGEFSRLYSKWFLSPIPPNGGNLELPMSAALKQLMVTPNDKGL